MPHPDHDDLQAWIGRREEREEIVTPTLLERFNATFDCGEGPASPGTPVPALLHLCLCQPAVATRRLGRDGHAEKGSFLPPVPLPRRMWVGGAIDWHAPIRVGDLVHRRSEISAIETKSGSTGPLCFVSIRHDLSVAGAPVLTERQDLVYREDGGASPVPPPAAPRGAKVRPLALSSPLLMRYSALTFNTHRIHYDEPYTREVEGYDGLVVHGPLQATLLALEAERLLGRPLVQFSYRSMSPIIGTGGIVLHANREGEALQLWTAREGGPIATKATAR